MKLANMLGERFRETPADCQIASQIFMIRGGYMKQVANGIYTLLMPAKRITRKIENIIREEMDAIDGQEVMFPVVMPADIWRESGRFDAIGSELMRMKDRGGNDMVLGMTHEEASVHAVRGTPKAESGYPFMIYQIQTKFRDEPRARGGLIRVRGNIADGGGELFHCAGLLRCALGKLLRAVGNLSGACQHLPRLDCEALPQQQPTLPETIVQNRQVLQQFRFCA